MKRNVFYLALTLVCAAAFLLYLFVDNRRTDTQPPTISFSEEVLELSALDPKEAFLQGVTARDDKDGDVTDSVVVASMQLVDTDGTVNVTYAAFDAAGNVTQAMRQVKLTDYKSPTFSLSTSLTFSYNSAFDMFALVQATDMLDGDISHRIRITSLDEGYVSSIGTHQVELRVSNSLGETVKLVVPVEVYAAGTYGATLTLTDYLIYLPAGEALDEKSYLDLYTRGALKTSLADGVPEGYSLEMKSNVRPDVPGVYTVEYRLTQLVDGANDHQAYTGYAKLIVVVEG